MKHRTLWLIAFFVAACGLSEDASVDRNGQAPAAQPAESASQRMMTEMTAHAVMMRAMREDGLSAALPMHRQMVGNMLAQMTTDMRAMNMSGNSDWNALIDSIRADVVALPQLSGAELQAAMGPHLDRVSRILDSHAAMMRGMGM